MEIGVGLPTTIPGVTGRELLAWARRGEELGFSSLGVIDRLMYDSYEPLVTLAAAAGATSRVKLCTTILIAAYRGDVAVLAKQLATLDQLAGGRLVLGVAAGGRPDDYAATGAEYEGRGDRLDTMLGTLRNFWDTRRTGRSPVPRARTAVRRCSSAAIPPRPCAGRPFSATAGSPAAAPRRATAS